MAYQYRRRDPETGKMELYEDAGRSIPVNFGGMNLTGTPNLDYLQNLANLAQQQQGPQLGPDEFGSYSIPMSDPTYRSGFDYARSIAGGIPMSQVIAPGVSYSPEQPMGYTQAQLGPTITDLPNIVTETPPDDPSYFGTGIGGVNIPVDKDMKMPPLRDIFGGKPDMRPEIRPLENLMNIGFLKAFIELMNKLVQSKNLHLVKDNNLNEIKSMIETFTIEEEKFINKTYNLKLGVSFDKKKVFNYLEVKNIFPSEIKEENFLFFPIILDQSNNDILVYSNNLLYDKWNSEDHKNFLINYILPTEDLEDLNFIRKNYSEIENYDFDNIIKKYSLDNSIIAIFFKDEKEIKILSKIIIKNEKFIKSNSFNNINFKNEIELKKLINELKIIYEDFWKEQNIINTSIKLPISIQLDSKNYDLSSKFEEVLNEMDLIGNFSIISFNKDFIVYEIIFNGTPKDFINVMQEKSFNFDTQNKVWILK